MTVARAYNIPNDHGPDRDWMKDAHCKRHNIDPTIFFPVFKKGRDGRNQHKRAVEEARKYCWGLCPVSIQCLQYAMEMGEQFGIYGGIDMEHIRPHNKDRITNG